MIKSLLLKKKAICKLYLYEGTNMLKNNLDYSAKSYCNAAIKEAYIPWTEATLTNINELLK